MGKRNSKIKWDYDSSTECLTDQSKNYYEDVFSPQSSTGVCAPIVGYEILKKRKTYSVGSVLKLFFYFVFLILYIICYILLPLI